MALDPLRTYAIGVGCRRASSADAIVALVRQTTTGLSGQALGLFTVEAKRSEPGLATAAVMLELSLTFLPPDILAAQMEGTTVRSAVAAGSVGVASVAEAAALAGAGQGARLLRPRQARDGVTCAVASASPVRP